MPIYVLDCRVLAQPPHKPKGTVRAEAVRDLTTWVRVPLEGNPGKVFLIAQGLFMHCPSPTFILPFALTGGWSGTLTHTRSRHATVKPIRRGTRGAVGERRPPASLEQTSQSLLHGRQGRLSRAVGVLVVPPTVLGRRVVIVQLHTDNVVPVGPLAAGAPGVVEGDPLGVAPPLNAHRVPHASGAVVLRERPRFPREVWTLKQQRREAQPLGAQQRLARYLHVRRTPSDGRAECQINQGWKQVDGFYEGPRSPGGKLREQLLGQAHHERDARGVLEVVVLAPLVVVAQLVAMVAPQRHNG
eukprot:m.497779 g.497779  ORF g.497779 m.497779 type:complete len:300 (-) comp21817_c0_seq12:1350-2249(-)